MKKLALTIALMSSFPTLASNGMSFKLENLPVCTLNVTDSDADITFIGDRNDFARATFKSNMRTTATISLEKEWGTLETWGGEVPAHKIHMELSNNLVGNLTPAITSETIKSYEIVELREHELRVALQTSKPTNSGLGEMRAVVQVSCQ